jgi:hypothetical protein
MAFMYEEAEAVDNDDATAAELDQADGTDSYVRAKPGKSSYILVQDCR